MAERADKCTGKHAKLALWIFVGISALLMTAVGYSANVASDKADAAELQALEVRVRETENLSARIDERLSNIQTNTKRLADQLDRRK